MPTVLGSEAIAKQRSSSRTPSVTTEDVRVCSEASKEETPSKSHQAYLWRRIARYLKSVVIRRWGDAIGLSALSFGATWGWVRTTQVLLEPPDALFVQIMSPVYRFLFACFVLSWLGTAYHGPGRVPHREQCSEVPPALKAALACGRFCKTRRFDGSDGWCSTCSSWKPAMANHCNLCDKCCMWMDHHCNFIGNCIGFRNARCFIVFLYYTRALVTACFLISVRYVYLYPPEDLWGLFVWMAWFLEVILHNYLNAGHHLKEILTTINLGWSSGVLFEKFRNIQSELLQLERDLNQFLNNAWSPDAVDAISVTIRDLKLAREDVFVLEMPVGIFYERGGTGVRYIFGEPPSWRWLVPFRPGGFQSPLHPCIYNSKTCAAWEQLSDVWERSNQVLQNQRLLTLKWRERMEMMASSSAPFEQLTSTV